MNVKEEEQQDYQTKTSSTTTSTTTTTTSSSSNSSCSSLSFHQIQKECQTMMKILSKLQQEEQTLIYQNKILSREAINLGYYDSLDATASITASITDTDTIRKSVGSKSVVMNKKEKKKRKKKSSSNDNNGNSGNDNMKTKKKTMKI